jgi:hypothetical protein
MLGDNIIRNLETAKKFYKNKLALMEVGAEDQGLIVIKSANSTVNVYRSQYAETNQSRAVTWVVVEDMDDVIRQLKANGGVLEHYDDTHCVMREDDVHVACDMK